MSKRKRGYLDKSSGGAGGKGAFANAVDSVATQAATVAQGAAKDAQGTATQTATAAQGAATDAQGAVSSAAQTFRERARGRIGKLLQNNPTKQALFNKGKNILQNLKENAKPENIEKKFKKAAVGAAFSIGKTAVNAMFPPLISRIPPISTIKDKMNNGIDELEKQIKGMVESGKEFSMESIKEIADEYRGKMKPHMDALGIKFGNSQQFGGLEDAISKQFAGGESNAINNFFKKSFTDIAENNKHEIPLIDDKGSPLILTLQNPTEAIEQEIRQNNKEQTPEEKEKTDTESFQEFLDEIKKLYSDFKLAPTKIKLLLTLAIILVLVIAILSIYYIARIYSDFNKSLLIKNHINIESLDYNISKSLSLNPATLIRTDIKYKFVLFLILPVIALLITLVAIYYTFKEPKDSDNIRPIIPILIGILIAQSVLSILVNYIGFFSIQKNINDIQKKISDFNNYVYLNLYKHEPFLDVLQMIPTNSFSMIKAIRSSMDNILEADKTNPQKIAKVLLTINIYIHLQKMGYKNPNIYNAFKLFNKHHTSDPKLFTPSDFLYRKPTYINNYSNKIIEIYKNYKGNTDISLLPGFIDPTEDALTDVAGSIIDDGVTRAASLFEGFEAPQSNRKIDDHVFELATEPMEEWIRKLNDLAYKMDPGRSFTSFIEILITIAIVSLIPLIIIIFAPKIRAKIFNFILYLTKSQEERLNTQIKELNKELNNSTTEDKRKQLQRQLQYVKDNQVALEKEKAKKT